MRKFLISVLIAMLAMVLVACDSGGGDSGGDAGGGSTSLSQSFTLPDGSTVNYPDGWAAMTEESMGATVFASDQSLIDMFSSGEQPETIESGQALVLFVLQPAGDLGGMSLTDLASMFTGSEGADGMTSTELEVDGKEAVAVSGEDASSGTTTGGYILFVNDTENGFIITATGVTAPGEQDSLGETIQAMVASLEAGGE